MRCAILIAFCCIFELTTEVVHPLYAQSLKKHWVYFIDKGPEASSSSRLSKYSRAYLSAVEQLSPRSLQRRTKTNPGAALLDFDDLPIYEPYVNRIERLGGQIQQRSRWLNAVSISLPEQQLVFISALPFVEKITPVMRFHGKSLPEQKVNTPRTTSSISSLDYGLSFTQVDNVRAIPLHQIGVTGNDVRVGMLDSGFRWRVHEALQSRNVIGEYDFIFHDSVTANESNDSPTQDSHGTITLSTLGGFKEGKLIGPAYDAEFLLAKTEYIPTETEIEEDNWVAGIEWLEAHGADIISSSLGYDDFNDGYAYSWDNGDFDGRTTVTAKAALHAARLGVLVCNSMGNNGNGNGIRGTMLTPADADSILAVGAITPERELASFSSTGPTNDRRIKPDIVALGSSVYCATPGAKAYGFQQGTSLSAPLVAASAALVLSARPELTAMQVRDILRFTADTTNASYINFFPNNFLGWGAVDAFAAALSFGPIFSNKPTLIQNGATDTIATNVVSKFGLYPDSVILYYKSGAGNYMATPMAHDSTMFFPTSGRYIASIASAGSGNAIEFYIEAKDSAGNSYRSPAPVFNKQWIYCCGATGIWSGGQIPDQVKLLQNYPNPFNSTTTITVDLKQCEHVEVSIYALSGQKVKTLLNENALPRVAQLRWDGENEQGIPVASGVYLVRLMTPSVTSTTSMLLLR